MHRLLIALTALLCGATSASAQVKAPKVLFVGNSITKHGPKADIDWHGNWGMAATAEDKDYVHLVAQALAAKQGASPEILVKNVADFERAYATYDIGGKFADAAAFQADLIILCIG
jgi:hypothetical protein